MLEDRERSIVMFNKKVFVGLWRVIVVPMLIEGLKGEVRDIDDMLKEVFVSWLREEELREQLDKGSWEKLVGGMVRGVFTEYSRDREGYGRSPGIFNRSPGVLRGG